MRILALALALGLTPRAHAAEPRCGPPSPFTSKLAEADDYKDKSATELHLLQARLLAHHCYAFKESYLQEYAQFALRHNDEFTYAPKATSPRLSPVESANLELLKRLEREARGRAEAAAQPMPLGRRISLKPGREYCHRAELLKGRPQTLCVFVSPTGYDGGSITLVGRDWAYHPFIQSQLCTGTPGWVELVDHDPRDEHRELNFDGMTAFRFDGAKALRLDELEEPSYAGINLALQGEEKRAADALGSFFSLLHEKRYSAAAELFGGNPVPWKERCEGANMQCLRLFKVLAVSRPEPQAVRLKVQVTRDGKTPWLPCRNTCEFDRGSALSFDVKKKNGRWLVFDKPRYCE